VEGEHLIQEAYMAGFLQMVLWQKDVPYQDIETYQVSADIIEKLSNVKSNQGMIGVCRFQRLDALNHHVLLLDGIQDPGNMGTLIRSAVAFNFDTIVVEQCVDLYNAKVIRATQGAIFKINLIEMPILSFMDHHPNITYMATDLSATDSVIHESKQPLGLILGNEGAGVRSSLLNKANQTIKIQMTHTESLNVAVAGSILMYELGGVK